MLLSILLSLKVNAHIWSAQRVRGQTGPLNVGKDQGHDGSMLSRILSKGILVKD